MPFLRRVSFVRSYGSNLTIWQLSEVFKLVLLLFLMPQAENSLIKRKPNKRMGILVFDLNQGFERIRELFRYFINISRVCIKMSYKRPFHRTSKRFLIESTPFGFNPTKLTKSCPNGNEERRTKISFIFLKRRSKIYFKDNYTDTAELSHIVISVGWLNVFIFTHSKEEMLFLSQKNWDGKTFIYLFWFGLRDCSEMEMWHTSNKWQNNTCPWAIFDIHLMNKHVRLY